MVQLIRLPSFQPGALVSVAHPDAATAQVFLLDEPVSDDAAERFVMSLDRLREQTLPVPARSGTGTGTGAGTRARPLLRVAAVLVAGVIAVTVTPSALATWAPVPVAGAAVDAPGEATARESAAEETDVFSSAGLAEALAAIAAKAGSDEAFRLVIYDTYVIASVPTEAASANADEVVFRRGEAEIRRPDPSQPTDADAERFTTYDVEWDAVLGLAATVPQIGTEHGVDDAAVTHVVVRVGSVTGELEVLLLATAPYGSLTVFATPTGEITRVSAS